VKQEIEKPIAKKSSCCSSGGCGCSHEDNEAAEKTCFCDETKRLKHVHGPNCGHPYIYHNDHVDYIVDGTLHHFDRDHCDNHGKIGVVVQTEELDIKFV